MSNVRKFFSFGFVFFSQTTKKNRFEKNTSMFLIQNTESGDQRYIYIHVGFGEGGFFFLVFRFWGFFLGGEGEDIFGFLKKN